MPWAWIFYIVWALSVTAYFVVLWKMVTDNDWWL